jgi:GT2 family glycosyltransferase
MWANDSWSLYRILIYVTSSNGQKKIGHFTRTLIKYLFEKITGIKLSKKSDLEIWMGKNYPDTKKLKEHQIELRNYSFQPKISIIFNVTDFSVKFLRQSITSLSEQVYQNWELCISANQHLEEELTEILNEFSENTGKTNVYFSGSAFEKATGTYIALAEVEAAFAPDALFQCIRALNVNPAIDLLYSDEDQVDDAGTHSNFKFKPDWCPDSFLSGNYLGHLVLVRKVLLDEIESKINFESDHEYDLLLRLTEKSKVIHHIPELLYHRRMKPNPASFLLEKKALEEALTRRGIKGKVSFVAGMMGLYQIRYEILKNDKVSIIIPTKDKSELCETLLSSLYNLTDYPDYEVILVNNNSTEKSFFDLVSRWENKEPQRFKCITDDSLFNFSRLVNKGAQAAAGDYLLLLNNDTEVIHADWLSAMVEQAQFRSTGAVGARLLFHNDTIQHAGIIIGLGGIACHTFVGADKDEPGYWGCLKSIANYSAVTAACLMVRKETYWEVGGFDEQFSVEFNDVDFCLKLKEKGYNNIYLPHVTLYHYESLSRGHTHKRRKTHQKHLLDKGLFQKRWKKYIDHDPCYSPHLSSVFSDFRLNINDYI